jgi:endonuclease/exonuclease/phosphatase family metal-dependent hydrolase
MIPQPRDAPSHPRRDNQEHFALGEIDKEEFEERRQILNAWGRQHGLEEPVNPLDGRNQRARQAPLRIMTYNVHRCVGADRRADPRRIAEVIAACQPDMVALQELDVGRHRTGGIDQVHAIAHLLGMSVHFHPALQVEEELYGDAILSALPMRLVKAGPLPGSVGFEPRGALWAAVEANGTEIQIINTHLGLPAYERMKQAKTLLGQNWLDNPDCRDPVILLGDFNARRQSVVYRMFTARLRDAQLVLHKRARRTFPARMPMLRIDHIFCGRSVEVLGVEVLRSQLVRTASDHLPLVMDFRIVERGGLELMVGR